MTPPPDRKCDRGCMLPYNHPSYKEPTPEDVKQVIESGRLSHKEIAALLGISYTTRFKSSTIRRWYSPSKNSFRRIPYPTWRLLLIYMGAARAGDDVKEVRADGKRG